MNMYLKTFTLSVSLLGLSTVSFAQPGNGIRLGPMTSLTPELSSSWNYNDNSNLRRRALSETDQGNLNRNDSDQSFSNQLSLSFLHLGSDSRYTARGWYGMDSYDKFSELDSEQYGINTGWFWARPNGNTTFKADLSYQFAVDRAESSQEFAQDIDLADELENVSERVERDILKATTNLSQQLITDVKGVFIFSYDETDYEQDRFNDRTRTEYILELNYQYSPKTQPYGRVGISFDEDDGFDGDAEKPFFLVGVRYSPTPKLNVDAGVGYETYTRTPLVQEPNVAEQRFDLVPGEELEDSNLKYTLSVNYMATNKTRLSLRARNGYNSVASPGSSSREEMMISLVARHQTTNTINQSILVSWREDDYLSPIPAGDGMVDELKETLRYQYEINYQTVRPWLSLFGKVSHEDGSSEIPGDDYTELSASLGAKLRY